MGFLHGPFRARIRFYGQLNDFVPAPLRHTWVERRFERGDPVKVPLEALGVPHPEIDLVLVNGDPVGFEHLLRDGDLVSAFPPFTSIELGQPCRLRPPVPVPLRFVVDVHLGRLGRYLRLLGFDTCFGLEGAGALLAGHARTPEPRAAAHLEDAGLARLSRRDGRVLVTRDRGLLKRAEVVHGYCPRSDRAFDQLKELDARYHLGSHMTPFTRCARCNGMLVGARAEALPEGGGDGGRTSRTGLRRCGRCDRVYWEGPHQARLRGLVAALRRETGAAGGV